MAQPIYARNLMALLRYLGWQQKDVAQRLGVSTAAVSMWGRGKRPVPAQRWKDLWRFVRSEMDRDHAQQMAILESLDAGEGDFTPEERAREAARIREAQDRAAQVRAYLDAWDNELDVTRGYCAREVQRALAALGSPYAATDPMKMPREDRQRLKQACRDLLLNLGRLDTFEATDGRELSLFSTTSPEYLDALTELHFGTREV